METFVKDQFFLFKIQFKSHYVVWKQYSCIWVNLYSLGLNRTM